MGRGPKVPTVKVECRCCGRELDATPVANSWGHRVRRHKTHPGGPFCVGATVTNHRPVVHADEDEAP